MTLQYLYKRPALCERPFGFRGKVINLVGNKPAKVKVKMLNQYNNNNYSNVFMNESQVSMRLPLPIKSIFDTK